ncbi:MAG: hypothetical protein V4628_17880 [Pseudomonadota bacterium]
MLNLFLTSPGDAGLASLGNLGQLRTLLIDGTNVSDESLAILMNMPALSNVSLFDTDVTDAGVQTLGAMEKVNVLLLGRTAVSEEANEALQESLRCLVFTEAT